MSARVRRVAATTWGDLVRDHAKTTFLWQDLDGLRRGYLPRQAPNTSLLHGWSADGKTLVRVRLDGNVVRGAEVTPGGDDDANRVVPRAWGVSNGRTRRFQSPDGVNLDDVLAQVEVLDTGSGALVFLVPRELSGEWE